MQRSLQEAARKESERFRTEMACKDEQAYCTTMYNTLYISVYYNLETELKNTKTLESADITR